MRPITGTRLLREWQGVEFVVTVTADGFEWQGRPYKSLSAIARAIISLAHTLQLRVIAEGVETREQEAYIVSEGCDEGQGYYYSKPLPPREQALFIKKAPRLAGPPRTA